MTVRPQRNPKERKKEEEEQTCQRKGVCEEEEEAGEAGARARETTVANGANLR